MNILVVCHYGLYEDLTFSFVHQQAKAYAALGHRIRVLIPTPVGKRGPSGRRVLPALEKRQAEGVELFYLRYPSLSNFGVGWFNLPSAIAALRFRLSALLQGFQPEVIHAHTLGFDSEIGAWLKHKLHCPLVVTTHGIDTFGPVQNGDTKNLRQYATHPDALVAVSSLLRNTLEDVGVRRHISVILNGFNIQNVVTETSHIPESILQVGYLIERKKGDITIQALNLLKKNYPDVSLTFIGNGPEQERFEALANDLGLQNDVCFMGEQPNSVVLAKMSKARFFAMPSVREGFGIVYLEAMASGCITIGTEGEGVADLIVSGENGFLVPPDDPDAIAKIISWCLDHPEEATAIAERGQQDARSLTWEKNAEQYIALFQSLTGEK